MRQRRKKRPQLPGKFRGLTQPAALEAPPVAPHRKYKGVCESEVHKVELNSLGFFLAR